MKRLLLLTLLTVLGGCCARNEWDAEWIGAPWDGEQIDPVNMPPAPVFSKCFTLSKDVDSAKVKICGLGLFEMTVNGEKVGEDVLVPNESSYTFRPGLEEDKLIPVGGKNFKNYRVYYLEYDLKPYLKQGENEVRVLLGNGFFSSESRRYIKSYGTPRLICRMDIFTTGGGRQKVVSDLSWKVAKSPMLMNDLFNGEIYDARLEGREEWCPVVHREAPKGKLELQTGPADRVMEVLEPKTITLLPNGEWEVDFGDYVTGWVKWNKLHSVPGGQVVEVVYPTAEYGNGIQKYICRGGQMDESHAPKFTWYTFRTVRIRGIEKILKKSHLCAEVVYSNVKTTGFFECSNPLINRINHLFWRAQTDNMHMGVPTDCPHRERGPYTGDGQVACIAVMHHLDANAFYRKWLRDISDCQNVVTGFVPNGAPWHPGCGGGVPWGAAMNIIPWEHYLHYGDISVLEEHFEAMEAQLRHMLTWRLEDGTMLQHYTFPDGKEMRWNNLGEWSTWYDLPSDNLVHTYYLWKCADNTARAARSLGKEELYQHYHALAEEVAKAFHAKFYDAEKASYGYNNGSNVFALAMGVPQERRAAVVASLKKEIQENGGHLNTGIFGTQLFFEVLCENGLQELAYTAMTKTDIPSYGYWVTQGADTLWEYWDGGHSRNHPMFGGGLIWLYRKVAGVNVDEQEPGYKHIIIAPTPVGDLKWAKYATETPNGHLAVAWEKSAKGFKLDVEVPEGSRATVYLPGQKEPVETGSGHFVF
ncbi:MAG: glycoside hydrolase family 78 protein [Bacteroidales bacterium]|nr:glycoside hydrolase family 78 protein [Bacteroidales bacterium]